MTLLFLNQYTKILKLLELYWFKEVFIARVIKEKGIQQNARGDQLHVMDQKFDILCHEIFHIEILQTLLILPWSRTSFPSIWRFPSNLILVLETMEQNCRGG